jgi:SCP-2 sterol transfer family
MTYFDNSEDVYTYIGGIFLDATADPELGPRLAASGVVLKLNCSNPDVVITVDFPRGKVYLRGEAGSPKPNITLSMDTDLAHRYWLGRVNAASALAKGQVRAKGAIPKILKLSALAKPLFPRYEASLRAAGLDRLVDEEANPIVRKTGEA